MKRRSNTSKQREEPTIFLDRNLGKEKLAGRLLAAGYSKIELHDLHFKQDEHDPVWLRKCGINEWVAFSPDDKIRREAPSVQAILESKGRVFLLPHNNSSDQWAGTIITWRAKILRTIYKHVQPFIACLNPNGIREIIRVTESLVEELEMRAYERSKRQKEKTES